MSKAPRAAFQRLDQRTLPLPVGSRLQTVRYNTFNADCSVGKWPRALTARRNRALSDSMALVPGMKSGGGPWCSAGPADGCWAYGVTVRNRGFRGTRMGRPFLLGGLRARVSSWPPLRLVR